MKEGKKERKKEGRKEGDAGERRSRSIVAVVIRGGEWIHENHEEFSIAKEKQQDIHDPYVE